jgi:VWFA-related protein
MSLRVPVRAASSVCAAAVLSLLVIVHAQQAPPPVTFQVEVNYVDIDAVVTDERGNFVADLDKSDFELFEDGKPQEISTFSVVDIPLPRQSPTAAAAAVAASSDVKSNAQPIDGRLYVIVLDDLNVSPLRTQAVVKAARQFIERHFGSNDLAAITYTSGRTDAGQEFTSERGRLLAAIDKFQGRKLRSTTLQKADHYFQQHLKELEVNASSDADSPQTPTSGTVRGPIGYSDMTTDVDDFERGDRAQRVLRTLRNLAEYMGGVRGRRKALLMFSEGIDYPIYDVFGSPAATTIVMATRDTISAAARANVSFFAIDPRGLTGMTSETIELTAAADPHLGLDARGLLAEMYLSQDSLRELAEETGGFASVNHNDVSNALARIVRANSTYYVLGYYPAATPRDGRFHKIEVRARRPGLRVAARKGYVSPRPLSDNDRLEQQRERERGRGKAGDVQTSLELREILRQPLQRNGLTLAVQAAPFKAGARQASVALAVEVDASRLHFIEQNGVFADGIELSFFALDERGRSHGGNFYQFNLALRPDTYGRVRGSVIRMNPRMTLAPGRYQLRIGVREAGGGEMGSVFYDLEVPNYDAGGLAMSGLLLTDGIARQQFTAQPDEQLPAGMLPGPAISRRTFNQGDVLSVFAEIYDNVSARDRRELEVATTLIGADGIAVVSSREMLGAGDDRDTRSRFTVSRQIPLANVKPGRYRLRVETRRTGSKDTPVARETILLVTPAA